MLSIVPVDRLWEYTGFQMGWGRFLRRRSWDEERAREIEAYLAIETADNIARGMSPQEARDAARRRFGNPTIVREEIYRMNTLGFIESLWHDLRFGLRMLWKSPGLTVVALLSLSLGIGATTAIFSVVYGVLVSPYPYARPQEIWAPEIRNAKNPNDKRPFYRPLEYVEVRKLPAFSAVMATSPENQLLTGGRAPENFTTVMLTGNAFQFLGVEPALGRTIQPSDFNAAGQPEPVIVISYRAWHRLFDGRPDALGKTLVLNDKQYTVIGVMPPRFGWWTNDGGWIPLTIDLREERALFTIVRLRPGVSKDVAEQQLHAMNVQLAKDHRGRFPKDGFTTALQNYLDITVASGEMQSSLRLLFGAVGFLLLIACANVANLQLARATSRAREIALRMSIGAGRSRVLRQLLTESVVLSLAGGALGVLLAFAIEKAVVALMPEFYVPNEARIEVNRYVLLFSVAISVLTGILFGLAPALECSRLDLVETLKDSTKGSGSSAAGGRARNLVVVAEVALSVVLLVGASLTVRGFVNLQHTDMGFQPDRVLMVSLQLPAKRYATYAQRVAFTQNILERVRNIPGAQSAAIGNGGLPFGGPQSPFSIEGQPSPESQRILIDLISADYARTMGIPLLAGRALTEQEVAHADHVALINEAAAKLWPAGESAIGRRLRLDVLEKPGAPLLPPGGGSPDVTVVGILANTRNAGLRTPPSPAVFVPYTVVAPVGRTLAVRTEGSPMLLLNAVRQQVREMDKDQPLGRPITMEEVLGFETVQPRFNMALFGFFGMLGLALAAVGIFSVLSYSVVRRTHEIGVRMALGAERSNVLSLMLGMGGRLVVAGLALGLAGSLVLGRLLKSEVFTVPVTDPVAIIGVVTLLGAVALLACWLPARRAAQLDPMVALRHE
ncbi:MAG TPA: ABC transporter permease [Bryobacteraceae bacterium]